MFSKFSQFTINQRFIILLALAGSIAGLVAVTLWTQQPDMQVLFANLAVDDASGIIDKLKDAKVPYETANGGTTVLVPSAQVHDLRLEMAGQGLPHGGGVGYEIFDRTTMGMSDFVQKLNYRRALQGELARTITQMPEVERARVHLAIPERRLFATEQDRARASVVVSLRASQTLSKAQIQGVVHLVSSSVEGLQARDVTVVDGHGNLLSNTSSDESAGLSGTQMEDQRTLEKDIETRIQTMLGQEKSSGVNGASGGVPGVESNVPGGTEAEGGQTSSNNNQTKNETVNYEISRTVSRIVEPTGTIKKLSVAVLVDGTYEGGGKAGEGGADQPKKYVPRSEEEMKRIEEIVKKAMGYSTERQDQVEVVSIQFGLGAEEPAGGVEATPDASKAWMPYVRYAVGGVLFFLIFFMVVRPLMVMLVQSAPAAGGGETPALPASVGQVEAAISGKQPGQILDMAKNNPANTAVVVKQWLKSNA